MGARRDRRPIDRRVQMKKHDERTAEEIAQDLENAIFAEIGADDLREIFGGGETDSITVNCWC
jgi:hypothetical protein